MENIIGAFTQNSTTDTDKLNLLCKMLGINVPTVSQNTVSETNDLSKKEPIKNDKLNESNEITEDDIIDDENDIDIDEPLKENDLNLSSDDENSNDSLIPSDTISTDAVNEEIQNPIQNQIQNQIQVPIQNQIKNQIQVPIQNQVQNPIQNQIQVPIQNSIQNQIQNPNSISESITNKITLNVGGKKFNLKKDVLKNLNINYSRLQKITIDGRIIYFLDRDPYYFSTIIELIKKYGFDTDAIHNEITDYSEQLINELCFYGLLDKKFSPVPKLKLKRSVGFLSRHDEIVKIVVDQQLFETLVSTLSKSNFFNTKLKLSKSKQFNLNNIDPKFFRYVINFLRCGELYTNAPEIIELLDSYGIEYEKIDNKKVNVDIVSHYLPHGIESINNQLLGTMMTFDPNVNKQIINDQKYHSANMIPISYCAENINIINTDSPLKFGSEIVFNLADPKKILGESINELMLCIDIPILKPTDNVEYVDQIEYQLIEYVQIIDASGQGELMMQFDGSLLYLKPIIYTNNSTDYHQANSNTDKKTNVLYNNDLISVHRNIIPLFLFRDKQGQIPIKKLTISGTPTNLVVKMAPLKNLFKNKTVDIPLLNVCLIANYMNVVPLTAEPKPTPYLFDRTHIVTLPIQPTQHPTFDVIIIPLDGLGYIKDFFFTLIDKNDIISGFIDKFSDNLIEMEILQFNPDKKIIPYSKLDTPLLNTYIPLNKLGHKLPTGIYYYSFSLDPMKHSISGGLLGSNYFLRIKVKKMSGHIRFYANEYYLKSI
jgi:hypothetical protein